MNLGAVDVFPLWEWTSKLSLAPSRRLLLVGCLRLWRIRKSRPVARILWLFDLQNAGGAGPDGSGLPKFAGFEKILPMLEDHNGKMNEDVDKFTKLKANSMEIRGQQPANRP